MDDVLRALYERMISHLSEWSNTPRPDTNLKMDITLLDHPKELDELGKFREVEWAKYCNSRDQYLAAYK